MKAHEAHKYTQDLRARANNDMFKVTDIMGICDFDGHFRLINPQEPQLDT